MAPLRGMFTIIQADAEDIGRHDRGEELAGPDRGVGNAVLAEDVAGDFARGAVGLERGVGRTGRSKVTDDFHEERCRRNTAASPALSSRFSAMAIMAS